MKNLVAVLAAAIIMAVPALGMAAYANVIVVAKSGGDFTNPIDAFNSISDASATNTYLIKIMPGVYDIGDPNINHMNLKSYVDIEGSGEGVTKIIGTVLLSEGPGAVLMGNNATNTEIRFLTIEATSDYTNIYADNYGSTVSAFYNAGSGNVKFTHSTLRATNAGHTYGVFSTSNSSTTIMRDVTIFSGQTSEACVSNSLYADSHGLFRGIYDINNSTIIASGVNDSWTVLGTGVIKGSTLKATLPCVYPNMWSYVVNSSPNLALINTQLAIDSASYGGLFYAGATPTNKCIGVYDVNFAPVTCQ